PQDGDLSTLSREAKWQLPKVGQGRADRVLAVGRCEEEEKAPRARAENLASHGPCGKRPLVPAIDLRGGDPVHETPLELPVLMEQPAECVHIAGGEPLAKLVGKVAHLAQRVYRPPILDCAALL